MQDIYKYISSLLYECGLIYGERRDWEELCQIFAADVYKALLKYFRKKALGPKEKEVIHMALADAFSLHRQNSAWFPRPSEIIALLPECLQEYCRPVPMVWKTKKTPGMAKIVQAARAGDKLAEKMLLGGKQADGPDWEAKDEGD